jgi:hypothetical protein
LDDAATKSCQIIGVEKPLAKRPRGARAVKRGFFWFINLAQIIRKLPPNMFLSNVFLNDFNSTLEKLLHKKSH